MDKTKAQKFIKRFLLLTLLTVVGTVIALTIVTLGAFFSTLAAIILIGIVFVLLSMDVYGVYLFFQHVFDKKKDQFEFLYFFNVVFSIIVTGIFLIFYFVILAGILVVLLPFLA